MHIRHFSYLPKSPIFFLTFLICMLSLTGCSNLLFYPLKQHLYSPAELQLSYEDIYFESADKQQLHAWWIPAQTKSETGSSPLEAKGNILFLHGNAENISTHFINVAWLAEQGFNVFALDYRGFGRSSGEPDLDGALLDTDAAFKTLLQKSDAPVYMLGQSIGAAISMTYLGSSDLAQSHVQGLIVDSGFASFRGIAREKLDESWITWPLQVPLSWLIPSEHDPERYINNIAPIPILFFHSSIDRVVPYHHGQTLMSLGSGPQYLSETKTLHIGTFEVPRHREELLEFLNTGRLRTTE